MRRFLKLLIDTPIDIGSAVKFKKGTPAVSHVGEVVSFIGSGERMKYEVYLLNKRCKYRTRSDGSYYRYTVLANKCKHVDINFKLRTSKSYEIGDVVRHGKFPGAKYGVVVGFVHPDELLTKSYEEGYNGTDLICCVEIDKRTLTRKRLSGGLNFKRFTCTNKRLKICEVDLWDRKGPRVTP